MMSPIKSIPKTNSLINCNLAEGLNCVLQERIRLLDGDEGPACCFHGICIALQPEAKPKAKYILFAGDALHKDEVKRGDKGFVGADCAMEDVMLGDVTLTHFFRHGLEEIAHGVGCHRTQA